MAGFIENKQENKKMNMAGRIMGIYALIILCVFPVVYHNFYFDILETKYQFYSFASIAMIVVMLVYGLFTNKMIDYCRMFKFGNMLKTMNSVDWAVLAFLFANMISWLICDWRWEAFWGTSGRYNGVFLMSVYTVVYFLMTRFIKMKRIYVDAFLVVGIFVCLFGISDYFQMDLLGFKEFMMETQKTQYTSTFGNINTYTVYVGAVFSVSMMLFTAETCVKRLAFYAVVMAISLVALFMGESDNAYLTLAALFGFSPLCLFATKTGVRRYLNAVAIALSAIVFVGWINTTYAGMVIGLGGIFRMISSISVLPIATVGLWVIVGVWAVLTKKGTESKKDEIGMWLRAIWMVVIVAVVAIAGYVLYDANIAGHIEKYETLKNYVVFDDRWGTWRGYVWRCSVELYDTILTPVQKLFGYGSDTFRLLMLQYYPVVDGTVFDSAHNEYLHFLVTTGMVGMLSYIAIIVTAVWTMAKNMKNRAEVMACMFVVVAYAVQALVNINLPVVFPIIWVLLSMGLSKDGKEAKEGN